MLFSSFRHLRGRRRRRSFSSWCVCMVVFRSPFLCCVCWALCIWARIPHHTLEMSWLNINVAVVWFYISIYIICSVTFSIHYRSSNFWKFERTDFQLFDIHSSSFAHTHTHIRSQSMLWLLLLCDDEPMMATATTCYTLVWWKHRLADVPRPLSLMASLIWIQHHQYGRACMCVHTRKISTVHSCWSIWTVYGMHGVKSQKYHMNRLDKVASSHRDTVLFHFLFSHHFRLVCFLFFFFFCQVPLLFFAPREQCSHTILALWLCTTISALALFCFIILFYRCVRFRLEFGWLFTRILLFRDCYCGAAAVRSVHGVQARHGRAKPRPAIASRSHFYMLLMRMIECEKRHTNVQS